VKGFAVTLSLGIAASMFTAIFGTRLLFDYLLQKRRMKKLSI
jgi:preprotein translocase subunit SecD